ncbi:putative ribosome biogenesis protein Noc4 [Peziza echinospora]|nr:putative ribosome biogenesis protein Noc4 [Peziza echinospora]
MAPTATANGKKRKSVDGVGAAGKKVKGTKAADAASSKELAKKTQQPVAIASGKLDSQEAILELEEAIVASQRNYNGIVTLLGCLQDFTDPQLGITSAVSLCRTFCRLMALGRLTKKSTDTEAEETILLWLKERYKDYVKELAKLVQEGEGSLQTTALTLLMRLLKDEGLHLRVPGDDTSFPHDLMLKIAQAVLYSDETDSTVRDEFVTKYLDGFHDVRYSFLHVAQSILEEASAKPNVQTIRANMLAMLMSMENLPLNAEGYEISPFYVLDKSIKNKKKQQKLPPIASTTAHRRQCQDVWLCAMKLGLTEDQMKTVLGIMTHKIVPFFAHPQLLMDLLTDSYDAGGVMSLLALQGLFELIKLKNLDYPNFYTKLYALFDRNLMHVRYRSQFFRLMELFLASTHLPAVLIGSFIKRMSRLCLTAPPASIVVAIPFIYNLLKSHPTCTFMIHRQYYDRDEARKAGTVDPFDNDEKDPFESGALESSLWELEMLQSHYHPSVATMARIISEQFTKHSYGLEDFLDHSYASMIDSELSKNIKQDPVVEYEIPKRIFTQAKREDPGETSGDDNQVRDPQEAVGGNTLTELWAF